MSSNDWDETIACAARLDYVQLQLRTGGDLPNLSLSDQTLLSISTSKIAEILALKSVGRNPMPVSDLIRQVTSDRLALAGMHLRVADELFRSLHFRSCISRYYYSMYHSARAIVFASVLGDDYERHSVLHDKLPDTMPAVEARSIELKEAKLLRNEADYDAYPVLSAEWSLDARAIAVSAANFVQECESFALTTGLI